MFSITQPLQRANRLWSQQRAVVSGRGATNWQEMLGAVARFATFLRSHGLEPGDRVAMLALNSERYLQYYMAAPWADLIMVTLNTRWSERELTDALQDAGVKLLLVDDQFAALGKQLAGQLDSDTAVVNVDDSGVKERLSSCDPCEDAGRSDDQTIALFFTGGTTGRSKGVMLTSPGLLTTALQVQKHSALTQQSVVLHVAPFFHMAAGGIIYATLLAGACSVVLPAFDPVSVARAIEDHGVTHILLVPTMIEILLHNPDFDKFNLSSLKRIVYGSSPMPEALLRLAMQRLPGVEFTQFYGMTELSPVATVLPPADHGLDRQEGSNRLRSAGIPIELCCLKIVDEAGKEVAQNVVGEVAVAGPAVMKGYWNNPRATAAAIRDRYLYTGDAGYVDADGYLYLVDRIKDMIISGGENVYSTEVEQVIYQYPGVQECAVVGRPDEKWGEVVCAMIFTEASSTIVEADLIAFCARHIASYKCPKKIIVSATALPKTGAGKIAKTEIRKCFL